MSCNVYCDVILYDVMWKVMKRISCFSLIMLKIDVIILCNLLRHIYYDVTSYVIYLPKVFATVGATH